jgi:cytochrome b pre-mRNA-processing protein 3
MLGFLFRGLTTRGREGRAMFESATSMTRMPHWYVEGMVPDTVDGRFLVLSTIIALLLVRLERDGDAGNSASVALTERFIEVMESEHRELGLGDPTLGKTVRKLVGMLARRNELWREAVNGEKDWNEATRESLYRDDVSADALRHGASALKRIKQQFDALDLDQLGQGKFE